jgi:hypothetical protein
MVSIIHHPWTIEPTRREAIPTGADLKGLVDVTARRTDGCYPIGVLTADGTKGVEGRALHVQTPWSEAVLDRPDARPRALAYAKAMGSRAFIVDAPGIGVDLPRLPDDVIRGVRQGDLHAATRMQWPLVGDALKAHFSDELYGLGVSQGAVMLASSMATAPEGVRYDGAIFFESPGLFRQGFIPFAGRFAVDTIFQSKRTNAYRAETPGEGEDIPGNPAHMRKLAKAIMQHPDHYAAYVAAMSKGGLEKDLTEAYERGVITDFTELVFVTGTDSTVSPIEWNDMRARSIGQNIGVGGVHLVTLLGENHGMYESTRRMDAVLQRIRKEIFAISTDAE